MCNKFIEAAKEVGKQAFKDRIKAPCLDKSMMELLSGKEVGEGFPLLNAWVDGWTKEKLDTST